MGGGGGEIEEMFKDFTSQDQMDMYPGLDPPWTRFTLNWINHGLDELWYESTILHPSYWDQGLDPL